MHSSFLTFKVLPGGTDFMIFRLIVFLLFALSISFNFYSFIKKDSVTIKTEPENCYIYPINASSYEFPVSMAEKFSPFDAFSIDGDEILFYSVEFHSLIAEDIEKKYGIRLDDSVVRNLQQLVFFFNDFQLKFKEGDTISFFVRKKDNKIVYARLVSNSKKSLFEAFLTGRNSGENYINADGYYLSPCMKNGPFKECAGMSFEKQGKVLIPVFSMKHFSQVSLPFAGKIVDVSQNKISGGSVEVFFPDYGISAVFQYLGAVSEKIAKDKTLSSGTIIGVSGYKNNGATDSLIYYLKRRDGTMVSPFIFHHIEKYSISDDKKLNASIMVNFYRKWLEKGVSFEKQFYSGE